MKLKEVENMSTFLFHLIFWYQFFCRIIVHQELFIYDSQLNVQLNGIIQQQTSLSLAIILDFNTLDEATFSLLDFINIVLNLIWRFKKYSLTLQSYHFRPLSQKRSKICGVHYSKDSTVKGSSLLHVLLSLYYFCPCH